LDESSLDVASRALSKSGLADFGGDDCELRGGGETGKDEALRKCLEGRGGGVVAVPYEKIENHIEVGDMDGGSE